MTIVPKIQVATRKPHIQFCAVFGGKCKVFRLKRMSDCRFVNLNWVKNAKNKQYKCSRNMWPRSSIEGISED